MDQYVEEFFNSHSKHGHYDKILPRPQEFDNWDGDISLTINYSNWIELYSNAPSMVLDLPIDNPVQMGIEATLLIDEFVKHRGEQHPGWRSIVLHGVDKTTTDDWTSDAYAGRFDKRPEYKWTEIADQCPTIVNWLKEVWSFREFHRVRFMLLEPGGLIRPHQDYDRRKLAAYNFALTNPPGVEFCMEEAGLIPWQAGEVRAIDIGRQHAVRNIGTQHRVHMIIHGVPNHDHRITLCRSYDKLLKEQGIL